MIIKELTEIINRSNYNLINFWLEELILIK
jgi:hypothetical protein